MVDEYTERVVAFIDILGFSNLVSRLKTENELHAKLLNALRTIGSYRRTAGDENTAHKNLEVSMFSDSIVISAEPKNLFEVLWASLGLQARLLSFGVFLRGGVSCGKLIHENDILYGEGMLEAYRLESGAAIYPRIIISPDLVGKISKWRRELLLSQDHDGVWYIDQFADGLHPPNVSSLLEDGWDPNKVALDELRSKIEAEIASARSTNVLMKLNWLEARRVEALEYLLTYGKPRTVHRWGVGARA